MDERYLSELFGSNKGYVAVASKAGEGKADWTEKSFLWPNDRQELVAWVDDRKNTDLFICPALRRSPGRRKNDGAHLQWLWADVDFQDIDPRHHEKIRARVQRLGNLVVWSGSGQNCHVYVRLDRVVHLDVWRRLNLGLRKALMADAKHTDNALLRIPGTQNYKPGGKAVRMESGRGVIRVPARLLKAKPWRDVVVTDEPASDGTWERVDLPTIPGGVRARVNMEVDEGVGRYGTRHAAVYQVTAWLSKRGYTSDQIHTLMAGFKPGLDKEDSERGYDLHQDIARCLAQHPTREVIDDADGVALDEEIRLEEATDDDVQRTADDDFETRVRKGVLAEKVRVAVRQRTAQLDFEPPPEDAVVNMADVLTTPREPIKFVVEGLAAEGHNVTITGQFKSGKTMLVCNLMRSFCDHTPFLDDRKVRALADNETVGFWSLEMDPNDLYDNYLIPQELEHWDKLWVLNGRGYSVNILTDVGRAWAVNNLKSRGTGVWVIDSWSRLCDSVGADENVNAEIKPLTAAIDRIKREAGVSEVYILAHTGRKQQEEDNEVARGGTHLDDWADARWLFTRDGEIRSFGVGPSRGGIAHMPGMPLTFDPETKRMALGGVDKAGARLGTIAQLIEDVVKSAPGQYSKRQIEQLVMKTAPAKMRNSKLIREGIQEAIDTELIRVKPGGARGAHYLEPMPMRSANGGATAAVLDMSKVKDRPARKNPRRE